MTSSYDDNCNASNEVLLTLSHILDDQGAKTIEDLQKSLGLTDLSLMKKFAFREVDRISYTRILVPK